MLSSSANGAREMPKLPTYVAAMIAAGFLLQVIAFTTFAVFAPYSLFCSAPAFGGSPPAFYPCATILRTDPQTALQMLSMDHALPIVGLFLIFAAGVVSAVLLRIRLLSFIALILSVVWLIAVVFLISRNLPAPGMQNTLWYAFLAVLVTSFVLIVGANIRLMYYAKAKVMKR